MRKKIGLSLLAIAAVALTLAMADDAQAFGRRGGSSGGSHGSWGSRGSHGSWGGRRHWRRNGSNGSHGSNGSRGSYGGNGGSATNGEVSNGEPREAKYRGDQKLDQPTTTYSERRSDNDREMRDRRTGTIIATERSDNASSRESTDSRDSSKSDQDQNLAPRDEKQQGSPGSNQDRQGRQ